MDRTKKDLPIRQRIRSQLLAPKIAGKRSKSQVLQTVTSACASRKSKRKSSMVISRASHSSSAHTLNTMKVMTLLSALVCQIQKRRKTSKKARNESSVHLARSKLRKSTDLRPKESTLTLTSSERQTCHFTNWYMSSLLSLKRILKRKCLVAVRYSFQTPSFSRKAAVAT